MDAPQGLDSLAREHTGSAVAVRWIVDAMNVIGCRPDGWWRDRRAAMSRLVADLDRWAAVENASVAVVFERPLQPPLTALLVTIAYAPASAPNSADDEIVRIVAADAHPDTMVVVTSDRGLRERVQAYGAGVCSAAAFRDRIEAGG